MIGGLFGEMRNCFAADTGYELYTFLFLFTVGLTVLIVLLNSGRATNETLSTYVLVCVISFINLLYLLNCYSDRRWWSFFIVLIPILFLDGGHRY